VAGCGLNRPQIGANGSKIASEFLCVQKAIFAYFINQWILH